MLCEYGKLFRGGCLGLECEVTKEGAEKFRVAVAIEVQVNRGGAEYYVPFKLSDQQ